MTFDGQTRRPAAHEFRAAVENHFGFLARHGFKPKGSSPWVVRYESPTLIVQVWLDRGELEGSIGLLGDMVRGRPVTYGFQEVLRFEGWTDEGSVSHLEAGGTIDDLVAGLAGLVSSGVGPALRGDRDYFNRLKHFRTQEAREYSKRYKL